MGSSMINHQKGAGEFVKRAATIASYYGFVRPGEVTEQSDFLRGSRREKLTSLPNAVPSKAIDGAGSECARVLKMCGEVGIISRSQPLLCFHTSYDLSRRAGANANPRSFAFGLQAFGANQSVGEAVILKTALTILEETGLRDQQIYLNSIGDRDSTARFVRELTNILRRHSADLPPQAEAALKEDPMEAFRFLIRKKHPLTARLPRPIEFLSSASRRHFREVLEQLDATGIPYEIDDWMFGPREYYTETIFEIRPKNETATSEEEVTEPTMKIRGGRYDELSKRMFKVNIPAVGVVFMLQNPKLTGMPVESPKRPKTPKVYFVHLGTEAKRHSLLVIEALRRTRIPFQHSIADSGFSDQISRAERLSIPYLIIMGQKEAVENAVIVRNITTRSQQTVSIDTLPFYLKNVLA